MKVVLRAGEARREVRILRRGNRLQVVFEDGRTVEAAVLVGGGGVFELERGHDRVHGVGAALDPQARQVWVNGRTLRYTREQRAGAARASGPDASLAATIPAVVVEVLVAPGDAVADGQKLVLLESMKMVLPIVAPHAGVVTAVRCQPGDAVQPGVPLVELERAAGGAAES